MTDAGDALVKLLVATYLIAQKLWDPSAETTQKL